MLRSLLIPAIALIALPASAEHDHDPAADAADLRACLSRTADGAACIGLLANPCMETPDGGSTLGMSNCVNQETAAWDILLNEVWPEVMAQARATDEEHAEFGTGATDVAEQLLTAQRAWLAFRDAQCGYEYAFWSAGTIRSNMYAGCMLDMTAKRTLELRDQLNP